MDLKNTVKEILAKMFNNGYRRESLLLDSLLFDDGDGFYAPETIVRETEDLFRE